MSLATPRDASWRPGRPAAPGRPAPRIDEVQPGIALQAVATDDMQAAVASGAGLLHEVNEDCHSALDARGRLFVVADGVGGGALAARVSRALVGHLHGRLEAAASDAAGIRSALLDADRDIARDLAQRTDACGAATVALCAASDDSRSRWLVAWVGDCRVYRLGCAAGEEAHALTVDDTYARLGESPPPGGSPDDPARMVGNGAVDSPNVRATHLARGAMLVLCSDGVHKHVPAPDLARLLRGGGTLAQRCMRLIACARERGSQDDATVLVVQRTARARPALSRVVLVAALAASCAGAAWWLAAANDAPLPAALQRWIPS